MGHFSHKGREAAKTTSAIDVGQEDVGRTLIGPVDACFQLVFAQDVVPVVLCLPRIHDAGLGKISGWSNAAERVIEIDSRDSLVKVAGVGDRIAKAISAE